MFRINTFIFGLLLFSPTLLAATYSWVDENGVTHYSQTRPSSGNYTVIKPSTRYPSPSAETSAKPDTTPAAPAAQAQQRQAPAAETTLDEAQCQGLKDDLQTLRNNPRIRLKTGDEYKYVTDEERQAMIDERVELVEKHCQ